jgi:hypothetical protein
MEPETPEQRILCAVLASHYDAASIEERLAIALATVNYASRVGKTTCDVFRNYLNRRAPSAKPMILGHREAKDIAWVHGLPARDWVDFMLTSFHLDEYQKNPTPYIEKRPWLACVAWYTRSGYAGIGPSPDKRLREETNLVWTSPTVLHRRQAEFFCPK